MKRPGRRRTLLLVLLSLLLLRYAWLYARVGRVMSDAAWEVPSVVYGRPAAIRAGDDLGALRLPERLRRLSYRKEAGPPREPGAWSEDGETLRIFTRGFRRGEEEHGGLSAAIAVDSGRVKSLATADGGPLETLLLEPEEVARILGPRMEARRRVPLARIPKVLRDAVISAEDARFYTHVGIDLRGIARAAGINLRRMRLVQGGSTITQQLAKNFFLTPRRTLWRKIREAELALLLEIRFSKDEILEAYLNKIYFGQEGPRGIYGVEEASDFYFSRGVADLSLEESALLAGVIRSPLRYSPLRRADAAKERRDWVLSRMLALRMIGEARFRKAVKTPVRTFPRRVPVHMAAYFADYLRRVAGDALGDEQFHQVGYRFDTSLDPVHQEAAEIAVVQGLAELEGMRPRRGGPGEDGEEPLEAALVAVDPATGELTAMVGGRSYGETQFNRATDARRQPGSAFKPFVLLALMRQAAAGKGKATLATEVSGEPLSVPVPAGTWEPANYEGKAYGTMTVRTAIENSVNTAFVRLALDAGLPEVAAAARDAGISSPLAQVPSLALGSSEVTPLELAYAYATLASGGGRFEPYPLRAVSGPDGEVFFDRKAVRGEGVDPRAAFLVTRALEGVLDRGTGRSAREAGFTVPAAGKTGTTDENRDSWFIGYTPDLVCAVWVGRDSGKPAGFTGAAGALRIWTRFMKAARPGGPERTFPVPPGIVTAEIDPASGFLATAACPEAFEESFLEGTAPDRPCPLHPSSAIVETVRKGFRGVVDFFRNLFR